MRSNSPSEPRDTAHGATRRLASWFVSEVLPIWARAGFDDAFGGFCERLDPRGRPIHQVPYRLVTQARQIHVYALAAVAGWFDGADLARAALQTLERRYRSSAAGGGYVAAVRRDGTIVDDARETYGHAFVLLALSSMYRLTGESSVVDRAADVLAMLDTRLAVTGGHGFRTSDREDPGRLLQDPQMHYLEAMLAWHAATGDAHYLARGGTIVDLFVERLWRQDTQTLSEQFDEIWHPLPGDEGAFFKPGHHFEWSWLLRAYARASGRALEGSARTLYRVGRADGVLPDGRVADEVLPGRGIRRASTRLWNQCEWIRGAAEEHAHGGATAADDAVVALSATLELFCRADGLWTEHLDAGGRPLLDFVPATTLYHLLGAVTDARRVFDRQPFRSA